MTEKIAEKPVRYAALLNGNVKREGEHTDQVMRVNMGYDLHAHINVKAEVKKSNPGTPQEKTITVFHLPKELNPQSF